MHRMVNGVRVELTPQEEAEVLADRAAIKAEREAVVPASVTTFQFQAALNAAGRLNDAEAAIAAADGSVRFAWQRSPTLARNGAVAAALGFDPDEIDALFRAAARINP